MEQTTDNPVTMKFAMKLVLLKSAIGIKQLESKVKSCAFEWPPLTDANTLPTTLWIIEGGSRLFEDDQNGLSALARIGPGSSVGVASY